MDTVVDRIKRKMVVLLKKSPIMFSDLIDFFDEENYRDILISWGELREEDLLKRTPNGLYFIDN